MLNFGIVSPALSILNPKDNNGNFVVLLDTDALDFLSPPPE